MTINELIGYLSQYDPGMVVLIQTHEFGGYSDIVEISKQDEMYSSRAESPFKAVIIA